MTQHCDKSDINCEGKMKLISYLHYGTKPSFKNLDYLAPTLNGVEVAKCISPLIASIVHEDLEVLTVLLEAGADAERTIGTEMMTPLMYAVKTNNINVVRALLLQDRKKAEDTSSIIDGFFIELEADKSYVLEANIDRMESKRAGIICLTMFFHLLILYYIGE